MHHLRRHQETTLHLSVTRFKDHADQRLRNTMVLKFRWKETRRTFSCFEDGSKNLVAMTDGPTKEKLEPFDLDGFLSLELSSKVIHRILHGSFSDDWKEPYFEGILSHLVHGHAKDAVASQVHTVALMVDFEVMTDIFQPRERCMVCLVEFQRREAMDRKPCGHTYHMDCTVYYVKRNIDCPMCSYETESSWIPSSAAREFASDEDVIKITGDFPNTYDDESEEEESSEERPDEMCMVCLVEFRPRDVVERRRCGHAYHKNCMEYYIKNNVDCPTCYYDGPAESSSSGAGELASDEENLIKAFCDSLNIDETEEEAAEESGETCMVCLMEFGPREMMKRMPCGHAYHEDCMEYYIKHNTDTDSPRCNYDETVSSFKSWSGDQGEVASEDDIICSVSCDSCDADDDKTEEESSDKSNGDG